MDMAALVVDLDTELDTNKDGELVVLLVVVEVMELPGHMDKDRRLFSRLCVAEVVSGSRGLFQLFVVASSLL